jgi:hypothetical protein
MDYHIIIGTTYNPEICIPQNLDKARTRQRGMGVVSHTKRVVGQHQQIGSRR